jgi:hypothetical protein
MQQRCTFSQIAQQHSNSIVMMRQQQCRMVQNSSCKVTAG